MQETNRPLRRRHHLRVPFRLYHCRLIPLLSYLLLLSLCFSALRSVSPLSLCFSALRSVSPLSFTLPLHPPIPPIHTYRPFFPVINASSLTQNLINNQFMKSGSLHRNIAWLRICI